MLDNEIWNIISQAKGRVFMIFDCCHSETMFRHPEISLRGILKDAENTEEKRIDYGLQPRGKTMNVLIWSGCPDSGLSYCYDTGGFLTSAVYNVCKSYPKIATYDQIWECVKRVNRLKMQNPKRTLIGNGFGGPVFK